MPIQLAIGSEENFMGQIDLVKMKAIYWNDADQGTSYREEEIPAELKALADEWRAHMIEAAAEANDELTMKFLDGEELSIEEIKAGLRQRTIANEIVPTILGSSFKNKGVPLMLDAVIDYLPAPSEIPAIRGTDPDDEEKHLERHADDKEPFSALAFKIATDPFVGTLTFARVYSGVLSSGNAVLNSVKGKKERIGRMVQMHANQRAEIKDVCLRYRRTDRHEGRDHRRHPVRHGQTDHSRTHGLPRPGDFRRSRAENQGRPGKNGHRAGQAGPGRPLIPRAYR